MRNALRLLLVVVMATVGIGAVAIPAQADSTCATGNLCLWLGAYETSTKRTMTLSPGACTNLVSPWNNSVSSIANMSSSRYYAFTSSNCSVTPAFIILEPGWWYDQFDSTFNNTITSIQRAG